jgi:poly(3-hydroxyalkanoate) synthetase
MSKRSNSKNPQIDEHSVPIFWPFAAALAIEKTELDLLVRNWRFLAEAEKIDHEPVPQFTTANTVRLELDTLRLRDFSQPHSSGPPTLVIAPYAGHSAVIADHHKDQSLIGTLLAGGVRRVLITDWRSATPEMKDYDIDTYLADLNVSVDDLADRVNFVGLCQGGWMAAMYAARFPDKVRTLTLAGAPIDTDAGDGALKRMVRTLPPSFYEELVQIGGGLMLGRFMLEGWKSLHPGEQYIEKYLQLYEHVDDSAYLSKAETFAAWFENPIDLPGRWYLQAITEIFKENRFAKGRFVGLGRRLSLKDVTCPAYLLAGESDDITPREQVFAAERLLGTPRSRIKKALAPGGHIGLFMGSRTLHEFWPAMAQWIQRHQRGDE